MNILFVDDDHAFAESCVSILVGEGHIVSYSENAEDAKHKLYDSNFDIAIVDLMLPPTFSLKHIRKTNPNLICLMVTSKQENTIEIVAESMKAGATNFLDKGTNIFFFKLRTTIKEIILQSKDKIFLSHGNNDFIKLKIKDFIQERLKKNIVVLSEQPSRGLTIVEKLEQVSECCDFAVILMTKDDFQRDGGVRARQNVVHEIGFFQGKYGRNKVVLIAESGVELFSNISGIIRLTFESDHFDEILEPLRLEIGV